MNTDNIIRNVHLDSKIFYIANHKYPYTVGHKKEGW